MSLWPLNIMSDGDQVTSDQVIVRLTGNRCCLPMGGGGGGSDVTASKIAVRQLFLYKCEKFHGCSHREASRRHGSWLAKRVSLLGAPKVCGEVRSRGRCLHYLRRKGCRHLEGGIANCSRTPACSECPAV
jgi:hypothetical protein